jgi:hypothetical protein
MLKLLVWTGCLYAGLKFGALITGAGLGFGRDRATWAERLRSGEPKLLIGTLGLCALLLVYTGWWTDRFLHGHYAYATDCYSKLAASHLLPGRPARFGAYGASESARGYVRSAQIHGAQLGIDPGEIDRKLIEGRAAYSGYFAGLASRNERGKIAASFQALDRCLKSDGNPRGELLNPV